MKQNKKQKSFGNSLSVENLNYPMVLDIPNGYWNFSTFFDLKIEYLDKNNYN